MGAYNWLVKGLIRRSRRIFSISWSLGQKYFQAAMGKLVLFSMWAKIIWITCSCLFHCCLFIESYLFVFLVKKMSQHEHCICLISLGLTVDFCYPWAGCTASQCPAFLATSYSVVLCLLKSCLCTPSWSQITFGNSQKRSPHSVRFHKNLG